jgi:hypothetical protein
MKIHSTQYPIACNIGQLSRRRPKALGVLTKKHRADDVGPVL